MKVIEVKITVPISKKGDTETLEALTDDLGVVADNYCKKGEGTVITAQFTEVDMDYDKLQQAFMAHLETITDEERYDAFETVERTAVGDTICENEGRDFQICSYTIGDSDITVYDEQGLCQWKEDNPERAHKDVGYMVSEADAELFNLYFPFDIESTEG